MIDRELNNKILFVFLLCAVTIVTVTWVLGEKFIPDARLAYFINLAVAVGIAFLLARYLEKKINTSVDTLMMKIRKITQGDLTQRFKEDPEDPLPYGLSYELGEMMKFLRERVGGLWKVSALLIKQLDLFIASTMEALDEFRSEVEYFSQIGSNLEEVRSKTMEINKKFADLDVNTSSNLVAIEQVNRSNKNSRDALSKYKNLIHTVSNDLEDFNHMTHNLDQGLRDFFNLINQITHLDKTIKGLSTESELVKLNASIDAVQENANQINYQKLIKETELIIDKINAISADSSQSSTIVENKIGDLFTKVKSSKETVERSLDDTAKVELLLDSINEHTLEASTVYAALFDKVANLNTLMAEAHVRRKGFSDTVKVSIDQFDKLKSEAQITLLKFNQLEYKIEGIKNNLKILETFKNSFQIA